MAENSTIQQAREFIAKMSQTQKIFFASVFVVIIAGIIILFATTGKEEPYGILYSELSASDAGKITQSLTEKEIEYKLEEGGSKILVKEENLYDTRLSLANEGLPESGVVGYELFDKTNLGMSEFVQKLNYRRALEGELAKTISNLDEVKSVRVHIVIPEKALFKEDQKDPTASVTLHLKNGRSLSKINVEGIQNMVASSVEGMAPQRVTVVNNLGKILSEVPLDVNSIGGLTSQQYEQKRQLEEYLSHKVQSLLDGMYGVNNTKVRVNADLDFTKIEKTIIDFDPERQVVRSEQQIRQSHEVKDTTTYPSVDVNNDEENIIQNYEISKSVEHINNHIGSIKRLSAAVTINGKVNIVENEEGLKEQQIIERSEEEIEKLEEVVKNALGYDENRGDKISVIYIPYDTSLLDPQELQEIQPVPWWQKRDYQILIALAIVMLIAIFMMYRLLQNKYVKDKVRLAMSLPAKVDVDDELEDDLEEEEEDDLEDLELDEDELTLMQAELPEQLLLEGERPDGDMDEDDYMPTDEEFEKGSLADQAQAALEDADSPELTEDQMLKLEIRNKVQDFCNDQSEEAAKLLKIFLQQDVDERGFF